MISLLAMSDTVWRTCIYRSQSKGECDKHTQLTCASQISLGSVATDGFSRSYNHASSLNVDKLNNHQFLISGIHLKAAGLPERGKNRFDQISRFVLRFSVGKIFI
jgi:hypothetical protein